MPNYMEKMGACILRKANEKGINPDDMDKERFEDLSNQCKREVN